jgi:CheY-like chemotaxis protein
LGVRRDGDRLRIEVHDTGPGISDAQQQVIFEEFRRGDDAPGQGLGLGLSIADRIAQLLHVPLGLRSRPGQGTVFCVRVARAAGSLAPPSQATAPATSAAAPLSVLVVDNDPQALSALAGVLAGWGYRVASASEDSGAIDAMQSAPASLWLFDYHLDDGDTGVALANRLAERFGPRPTLILSADIGEAVRRAVHEAGLPLIAKPMKPLALKSVLDRLLASRELGPVGAT